MKKRINYANLAKRLLVFCAGQFILACGVVVAARSALGASSTTVVPNVVSEILLDRGITNIGLGTCTTVFYCIMILIQLLILRRDFKLPMLLEIGVSFVFGWFVSLSQGLLSFLPTPEAYPIRLAYMVVSIPVMALGVVVYISAQLSPAPSEGLTAAISQKSGLSIPTSKLVMDIALVCVSAAISLIYFHGFVGIREGTIICAAVFGPIMKPIMKLISQPLMDFCGTKTMREAALEQAEAAAFDTGRLIVTVDWEFGSGGDLLARDLAEKIGAKIYSNDELVGMETEESGLPERFVAEHEKLMRHSAIYDYAAYAYRIHQNLDPLDRLYAAQVRVVKKIAAEEKCAVILGHCGNYILRGDPNCFSVFIHAEAGDKERRSEQRHRIDKEGARMAMAATDRSRAKYHSDFTGEVWGQARYYDLSFSTTDFVKPGGVELITDALELWKENRVSAGASAE